MRYFIFLSFLILPTTAVMAQLSTIDNGIRSPQTMTVAQNTSSQSIEDAEFMEILPDDDAQDIADPKKSAPPQEEIDSFTTAPIVPNKQQVETEIQKIKRVVKTIPSAKAPRTIADDRIDDSYVQDMIKDNFNYNGTIE